MKKLIFVGAAIFLGFNILINNIFAQSTSSVVEIDPSAIGKAPIDLIINKVSFDKTSREIKLDYWITNNRSIFMDDLTYELEIYKGDKLAETGMLFDPLEFVSKGSGSVTKVAPGETLNGSASYIPSLGIESGNYFIRFVVSDPEFKYIGLDYTRKPLVLTGQDFFLGYVGALFRTSHGDDFLLYGQFIEKTEIPSIIIPLDKNPDLKASLDKGTKYSAEVKVYSFTKDEPVYTYPSKSLSVSTDKDGSKIIKYDLIPWKDIEPSPYDVIMTIKDASGRMVANDILARWWVTGFLARISDIKTTANYYKKDKPLDITVSLVSLNWDKDQKAVVEVSLEKPDGQKIVFSKDVEFFEDQEIDFSEFKMPEETMIKNISVIYKDKVTGQVFHTKSIEMTQEKIYSPSIIRDLTSLVIFYASLVMLLMLILLCLSVFYRTRNKTVLFIALALLVGGIIGTYFFFNYEVEAAKRGSSSNVWWSSAPSGNLGTCPRSAGISAYGSVNCGTCRNGMTYSLSLTGGYCSWGDQSHVYGSQTFGPCGGGVSVNSGNTSSGYSATFTSYQGCHCDTSSASIGGGPVSCTPRIDGVCNPIGSSLSAPASNILCSSGSPSPASVSGQGPWTWSCIGSGVGFTNDINCTANVLTPLSATCEANTDTANADIEPVTWTAHPLNGAGNYTYSWTGTDSLTGNTPFVTKTYTVVGTKYATTTVTSGNTAFGNFESITVGCTAPVVGGDDDIVVIPPGGGGHNGVRITRDGRCNTITTSQSFSSAPPQNIRCFYGVASSTRDTFVDGWNTIKTWSWICESTEGENSPECTASFNDTDSNTTSLDCQVLMTPFSAQVAINSSTTWTASSSNPLLVKWKVDDLNGSVYSSETSNIFNKIFTTTGLKTVTAKIASTTADVYGLPCSATTTVVQSGVIREQ